ncbi:MAG: DHHW family protein [Acutalibacteraceae bacterium]
MVGHVVLLHAPVGQRRPGLTAERRLQTSSTCRRRAASTESEAETSSNTSSETSADTVRKQRLRFLEAVSQPPVVPSDKGYEVNGVLISGTRGMEMFYGNTKTAAAFAQLLGKWRDALDDDVRLYSLVVPHASSYYAPSNYSYLLDYAERSFDVIADNMPAGVEYVDVYNLFKSHLDEPIYPRTEHHWNALAAYYAVGELCRLAGVSYPELSAFREEVQSGFVGSLYTFSKKQATVLKDNPEDFVFYVPQNTYTAKFYNRGNYDLSAPNMTRSSCLFDLSGSTSGKYATFLGADDYFVHIQTELNTGRNLVIFKDSYGNALAPFVATAFDNIYLADIRSYDKNGLDLVRDVGATDVVFAVSGYTACGSVYTHIERLLITDEGRFRMEDIRKAAANPAAASPTRSTLASCCGRGGS